MLAKTYRCVFSKTAARKMSAASGRTSPQAADGSVCMMLQLNGLLKAGIPRRLGWPGRGKRLLGQEAFASLIVLSMWERAR